LRHLLDSAEARCERGAALRSLTEQIDTGTAAGQMLYSVLGAVAQFERDVLRERTVAGLAAAKRRGEHLGRPFAINGSHRDSARPPQVPKPNGRMSACDDVARSVGCGGPEFPFPNCLTWGGGRNDCRLFFVRFPHCWAVGLSPIPAVILNYIINFHQAAQKSHREAKMTNVLVYWIQLDEQGYEYKPTEKGRALQASLCGPMEAEPPAS
jgi:hypothetical protein